MSAKCANCGYQVPYLLQGDNHCIRCNGTAWQDVGVTNSRNHWDADKFQAVLTRAGRRISCAWGVAGIRDRKTGQMETCLLFNDDDNDAFAYCFSFNSREEVAMLCTDLMTMADKIVRGEFGKAR